MHTAYVESTWAQTTQPNWVKKVKDRCAENDRRTVFTLWQSSQISGPLDCDARCVKAQRRQYLTTYIRMKFSSEWWEMKYCFQHRWIIYWNLHNEFQLDNLIMLYTIISIIVKRIFVHSFAIDALFVGVMGIATNLHVCVQFECSISGITKVTFIILISRIN